MQKNYFKINLNVFITRPRIRQNEISTFEKEYAKRLHILKYFLTLLHFITNKNFDTSKILQ